MRSCACRIWFIVNVLVTGLPGADLPLAAERGDSEGVVSLLEKAVDANAAQNDGMTALHWASYHDDIGMLRALIDAKAEPNVQNDYGITPLTLACRNGSVDAVAALLESGADPNSRLRGGETPLMSAARTGRIGPVKALLAAGARLDVTERQGQTALMWAAAEGHLEVVQCLLEAGADFQKRSNGGFTPLFFAVRAGHSRVVQALLTAGDDVNGLWDPKAPKGKAPTQGMSPLLLALENGHFELAGKLLECGADPNDERSGFTPLHNLVWVRKPNRGEDEDGDPSPQGSGTWQSLDLAECLLAHGAHVNARLKRGGGSNGRLNLRKATPLLMASQTADLPYMKFLVDHGADIRITNDHGVSPLLTVAGIGVYSPNEEAATEDDSVAALDYLISLGADLNHIDNNGDTVMHAAAYKSAPKVVAFLAKVGADPAVWSRPNKRGWTPLRIAHGYRFGNFKPSPETSEAIEKAMRDAGMDPAKEAKGGAVVDIYR